MITAGAVFAAVALVTTACGKGGTGARDEGPAHASAIAGAVASRSPSPSGGFRRVDAVSLIKQDSQVSPAVKRELQPCGGDGYPVKATYGYLTGGSVNDVLVNVWSCADEVGIGVYVYRDVKGTYENVFKAEESPVYAEIDGTDLTVAKQVYDTNDPVSNPSRETVTTYRWKAGRFAQHSTHETDYSELDPGDDDTPTPAPDH